MDPVRIFVSHSHNDDEFGVHLITDLRAQLGEDAVWYDSSGGLHGGDEWWNRIVAEITSRNVFIVIFSPNSVDSKWVIDEVNIAWALRHRIGTRIIPVLYQPCDLRADWLLLHSVSFVSPRAYEAGLAELLQLLDAPLDQVTRPVPSAIPSPFAPLITRLSQDIHAAFGQEEWSTVISKADLLLAEAPQGMSAALWRELGLAHVALGDGAAALPALEQALSADQFDASTLRGKGLAYALLGDPTNAVPLLDRAYTLAPFTDVSLRLAVLADLYRVLTGADRWEDALRRVQDALHLAPGDPEWLDKQLNTLADCGRDDEALRVARGLVSTRPAVVQQWVSTRLARDREEANWGDALRVIDLGLEATPNDAVLLNAKLEILTQTNREADALKAARMIANQNHELVDRWLRSRFNAHADTRDWRPALEVAEVALQALQLGPRGRFGEPTWLVSKSEALRALGRSQDAYATAEQASKQYANDVHVWISLAAAAKAIDNEGEVRRAIAQASRLEGEDSPTARQARAQYQEPYDRAAAERELEARQAEEARERAAREAAEAVKRRESRRRSRIIWLSICVVLLASVGLATFSYKVYQGNQAAAARTVTAQTAVAAASFAAELACIEQAAATLAGTPATSSPTTDACAHYFGKPYTAKAPGSCDKGGAKWTLGSDVTPVVCSASGARLTCPICAAQKLAGELFFQPTSTGFPVNYMLTMTVSNLASANSCGGFVTNLQSTGNGGIGYFVCHGRYWEIVRSASDTGKVTTMMHGTVEAAQSYNLTVAVIGDAHIMLLGTAAGGTPLVKTYYDHMYPTTANIAIAFSGSTDPTPVTVSNFTFTPLM